MENFNNKEDYLKYLETQAILPEGFKTGSVNFPFFPAEKKEKTPMKMNLSIIALDDGTESFAGVFTQNQFPGAPVIVGREMLKNNKTYGVVINNKISNVCAIGGVEDSKKIVAQLSSSMGYDENSFFPSSTGIIGWKLPVEPILESIPSLVDSIKDGKLIDTASAIMTTDSFAKVRRIPVGDGSIVGIVKGAGMIEPNMATMLCFIMTDLEISKSELQNCLSESVNKSFNRISVDSDQSTSDTVLIFSSNKKPKVSKKDFKNALGKLCKELSEDVVRNGEGTMHVMKVKISGASTEQEAVNVGKAMVNSPLVKTAICGNDPNVGRLVSSVGDYFSKQKVKLDSSKVVISIGDEIVFEDGTFHLDDEKELRLSDYLTSLCFDPEKSGYPQNSECVEIDIKLPLGKCSAEVIGSDLTHGYITENADYRS